MGDYQCINKKGDHFEPHERIDHVGNQMQGWKVSEKDAIRHIEHGSHTYYTSVNGKRAGLIAAIHNGRKYLKTTADGLQPRQSVAPKECMDCKLYR